MSAVLGRSIAHERSLDNDLYRWFWTETATGRLLVRVAELMQRSDDPEVVQHARHVAR